MITMIITPYGHAINTKSAAFCVVMRFNHVYCTTVRVRYTYCIHIRTDMRSLISHSSCMRSEKILESSVDVFSCRTVLF